MITAQELELHAKSLRGEPDGVRLVKVGADLRDSDLRDAFLRDADLRDSDLRDAFLRGAVLRDAFLRGAFLRGADLRGADLRDAVLRGADLRGAFLRGADLRDADLRDSDLRGAVLRGAFLRGADLRDAVGLPIAADAADRLKAVAAAALQPDALQMSNWHTCGTTHCIAGWAIHLAGEPGRLMESMMGPELAGLLLLGTEAHQHFYDRNEKALEYLRGVVADG
jgi:hypothetical protein